MIFGPSHGNLRFAEADDLPAIVDIYNEAIAARNSTCDLYPRTIDDRAAWFKNRDFATRPIWVADSDVGDCLAGYLAIDDHSNGRPGYAATADVAVYLASGQQGKGLGSRLLANAISVAPDCGITNLMGTIFGSNRASLRLFSKHGFDVWGTFPGIVNLEGAINDIVIVGRAV